MRKVHKNQLFNFITSTHNIEAFELLENQKIQSLDGDILQVKNSPMQFSIRISIDSYNKFDFCYTTYSPGFKLSDIYPQEGFVDFDEVLTSLDRWLNFHVKPYQEDLDEPDLWKQYIEGQDSLDEINFENQTEFSDDEKQKVLMSVNELKYLIKRELNTSDEEQKLINERLDYLVDSMDRLNKYDWKGAAFNSLFSIVTALSLDTEKGKLLFELFKKAFTHLLSLN